MTTLRRLAALDAEHGWDADRWADALDAYWDEHEYIEAGPAARGPCPADHHHGRGHLDRAPDHC